MTAVTADHAGLRWTAHQPPVSPYAKLLAAESLPRRCTTSCLSLICGCTRSHTAAVASQIPTTLPLDKQWLRDYKLISLRREKVERGLVGLVYRVWNICLPGFCIHVLPVFRVFPQFFSPFKFNQRELDLCRVFIWRPLIM